MKLNEIDQLTPRQREVLDLMCQGLPVRVMAERLHLSPHTVAEYRKVIFKRMGVTNLVELVNAINAQNSEQQLNEQPDLKAALETPPNLLVVEDDLGYRALVVTSLIELGFPCRGVGCRREVEAALAEEPANIVILDLNLGNEDGLVIAEWLRHSGRYGIIMMTTRGSVQNRIDGLAMGTDAYLVKPIDMRELVAVIRNLHRRSVQWQIRLT